MQSVLTLVAGKNQEIEDKHLNMALSALSLPPEHQDWLAPEKALDIYFRGPASREAEEKVYAQLAGEEIDVFFQDARSRRKKLLIADMDSTIVQEESLDELAGAMGLKDRIAPITARAMRGELDFKEALRERVAMLRGLSVAELEKTVSRLTYTSGARELVQTMKANGGYCVLVSGGFETFTSAVAEKIGFDAHYGNKLVIKDDVLTGEVEDPILDRHSKLAILQDISRDKSISLDATMAVGDGANDLLMLGAAGAGVAYHGKPAVQEKSRYKANSADLSALLYMQGYRVSDLLA